MAKKRRIEKSIAAAAKAIGVSERILAGYLAKGCPGRRGAYDVEAIESWRALNIRPQEKPPESSPDVDALVRRKLTADTIKAEEDARFRKIKNDQLAGRFYDKREVDQTISELVLRVAQRLNSLPVEMEMTFPAETRQTNKADLTNRIEQIRREMARWNIE